VDKDDKKGDKDALVNTVEPKIYAEDMGGNEATDGTVSPPK
jgi:hypothetical protein